MDKNKKFIDNYLGIMILVIFSVFCILTLSIKSNFNLGILSNISGRFFLVLIGLSALITAKTGMINLSAMPIGYVLVAILFTMNFSVLAWIIVLFIPVLLGLLFVFMQIKWKMPIMLFSAMIYFIGWGIVLFITNARPIQFEINGVFSLVGKTFIFGLPISLLVSIILCIICFVFLLFCPTIKEQRKGKKIPFVWVWIAQTACVYLGLLYGLLLSSRLGSFQPNFSPDISRLLLLLFFCFCSQKLDNKILPVIMVFLGVFIILVFETALSLSFLNTFYQEILMTGLAVGSIFMNRVYRIKGWYPMSGLSLIGVGGLGAVIIGIYQRAKNWGWGEWQSLE